MISKKLIRRLYLARREALSSEYISTATTNIISQIRNNPLYQKAKNVGIYYPIKNEVDLLELLKDNKNFYFPKISDDNLEFLLYTSDGFFMNALYNIPIPRSNILVDTLDLVIVPGLSYNADGYRIGYGKGFYDRYLNKYKTPSIGVCFAMQLLNFNFIKEYDKKVDYLIFNQNYKYNLVLLSAGNGTRCGVNKVYERINNKFLFEHSLDNFSQDYLKYVVINPNNFGEVIQNNDYIYLLGGQTRSLSLKNAIAYLINTKYTFIHDGARPYLAKEDIKKLEMATLDNYDGISLVSKQYNSITNDFIYLDKDKVINYLTPQVIKTNLLSNLNYDGNYKDEISNLKNSIKEANVKLVVGLSTNLKITTYEDLSQFKKQFYKIGHSFDLHPINPNRALILGGIKISDNNGLDGVSDGDCIIHAVSEAIFGALAIGDLGVQFNEKDPKNKGLDSRKILDFAISKLKLNNYSIINIDIMLYYELVKLRKYYHVIQKNLANLLQIDPQIISIKATTAEKLGPIGTGQAMGAEAVILLGAK